MDRSKEQATQVSQASDGSPPALCSLADRLFAFIWVKMLGSTVSISLFFVLYFWVLHHPLGEVRVMPLTSIDQWLPVLPVSAWVYFSLWFYICLPSSLMARMETLRSYLFGAILLSAIGLSIFFLLPTAVPNWGIDWTHYPILAFLKTSDASGNACPSLHVAFAVYAAFWLRRMFKELNAPPVCFAGNVAWCLLIILSTLFTKQHVVVDVLCGVLLALSVLLLSDSIVRFRACFGVGGARAQITFEDSETPAESEREVL